MQASFGILLSLLAQASALVLPTALGPDPCSIGNGPGCHADAGNPQPQSCSSQVLGKGDKPLLSLCKDIEPNVTHIAHAPAQLMQDNRLPIKCPAFYIHLLGNRSVAQADLRQDNVDKMRKQYPNVRVMGAVSWRSDWNLIKGMFKTLKLPVCYYTYEECGHRQSGVGKYARWASLILAFAYQRRFNLPCMTLLEDDVALESDLLYRSVVSYFDVIDHASKGNATLLKCGQWGDCFVSNPSAAKAFHASLYRYGVSTHSDMHIMHRLTDIVYNYLHVGSTLVVANSGDIAKTPQAQLGDFAYTSDSNPGHMQLALDAFDPADEHAEVIDLAKVARKLTNGHRVR